MDASWMIVVKDLGKNYKDCDFYIATWNVLSLHRAGMLKEVPVEQEKYSINIAAIKEIRWRGSAVLVTGNFILMYSGNESNIIGTNFILNRKHKQAIMMIVFFTNLMHKFFILIHLLYSSTRFKHCYAYLQVDNCIITAFGIVTLFR